MSKVKIKAPFLKGLKKKEQKKVTETVAEEIVEVKSEAKNSLSSLIKESKKSAPEIVTDSYHFNPLTNKYVFYLKSAGRQAALDEATVKNIYLSYSDLFNSPATIEDICRMLNWPRPCVEELIKILQLNHKTLPVTPVELSSKSDDEIIEDIATHRKFLLQQKTERKIWQDVQSEALKWREYEHNIVAPLERFLEKWEAPIINPLPVARYEGNDDVLLVSANDWHIASLTEGHKTFSGRDNNTEVIRRSIQNYVVQIKAQLANRKTMPSKCFILFNGDIIHSFADSLTRRGTALHTEYVNEEMFKHGLDIMLNFIIQVSSLFKETEISVGVGNHEGHVALYLGMAVEKALQHVDNIKITIEQGWVFSKWINNVYCLASHGAHSTMKGVSVPRGGNKLQIFVQNHLLHKAKEVAGATQRILLLGHYHSLYTEDFGAFSVYRFGAPVLSDGHGEALGYFNRPSQNCLLIGRNEVKEVWNIYLD